jgi:hypothetical protein
MSMVTEKIWILDELKLSPDFIEAYASGKAAIHDGVAYWAKGSGRTGVIQHLPFKEAAISESEVLKAVQLAQSAVVVSVAISTIIILAAIAVQTRYLAKKLDKIQETVDLISQDQHAQNIIFFMDKLSDYFGSIEVARTLLRDRDMADEINDVAVSLLPVLVAKRNHLLALIENMLNMARQGKLVSERLFKLIVDFVQMMLDLLPMGIHVEYLLAARVGKLRLAEELLIDGKERYDLGIVCYKNFLNETHREVIQGKCRGLEALQGVESRAEALFGNANNQLLLSLPSGRIEMKSSVG